MNTITIELCKEDRARLDAIIAGLAKLTDHQCACHTPNAPAPKEAEHPIDAPVSHFEPVATEVPVEEAPKQEEAPKAPKAPEVIKVEMEVFRGAVARYLAGGGDKEALRAYLTEQFGSGQVSAVPEDQRANVLEHFGIKL